MNTTTTPAWGICLRKVRRDGRRVYCGGRVDRHHRPGETGPSGDDPDATWYHCTACGSVTPAPQSMAEADRFGRLVRRRPAGEPGAISA